MKSTSVRSFSMSRSTASRALAASTMVLDATGLLEKEPQLGAGRGFVVHNHCALSMFPSKILGSYQ